MNTGKTIRGKQVWVATLEDGCHAFVDIPTDGDFGPPPEGCLFFGHYPRGFRPPAGRRYTDEDRTWSDREYHVGDDGESVDRLNDWADKAPLPPPRPYAELKALEVEGW